MNRLSTQPPGEKKRAWQAGIRRCVSLLSHCTLPGQCLLCCRAVPVGLDLCQHCEALWPCPGAPHSPMCLGCGSSRPMSAGADRTPMVVQQCPACRGHQWPWRRVIAAYRFDWPVDRLMRRFKAGTEPAAGRVFGTLLARAVWLDGIERSAAAGEPIECDPLWVVPMPMHPVRLSQRGFNQSRQLAHWCLRELNRLEQTCRDEPGANDTAGQAQARDRRSTAARRLWASAAWRQEQVDGLTGLARAERALQIMGAFGATSRVCGQRLVIVDDVLTTGASAGELARELLDQGARSVDLWVVARTPVRG